MPSVTQNISLFQFTPGHWLPAWYMAKGTSKWILPGCSAMKFGKAGKVTAQHQSSQPLRDLARLSQLCTVLTGHLPSTTTKEIGYRLPQIKLHPKSETIPHQSGGAAMQFFCHGYPTSSANDVETVLGVGETPSLQNKLKSPKQNMGH